MVEVSDQTAPTKGRPLTLGEHFFWTVTIGVAACLVVTIALFVG